MKNTVFILVSLVMTSNAFALPLLAENAAKRVSEVLTLYPDHEDANKFYYFPNSSELAKDANKRPMFNLVYTGLGDSDPNNGSGILNLVFRLKSNTEQKSALKEFLDQNPNAGLAVLPIKASTLSAGDLALFKKLDLPPHGGRAEDEMGITVELTEPGVKIVRGQAKAGTGTRVNYCYKVTGLGPTMDATVTIEWQQIYDYFRTSVSAGALWWRTTITSEVEKLKQDGKVVIVVNGGDAKYEDYVRKLTDMMIEKLFTPILSINRSATEVVFNNTPLQLNLNSVHKEELKTFKGRIITRDIVDREFCVDMSMKDVAPFYNDLVIDADKL
jgi:hypothetical protein